jgi:hypothetical protein
MTKARTAPKNASKDRSTKAPVPEFHSRDERVTAGQALRETLPRERHASWKPPAKRRDPIEVLEESNRGRMPEASS